MRLLHTSDWHLGQDFYRHDRHFEHKSFLDWLIQVLESEAIDVLLVSGDIFDTSNPSAAAQRMFYDFIRRAHQHCKGLQTIVVAGNHDSPGRIEAPAQLLNEFNVTVVGRVSYEKQKCVSQLPFIVPLRRRNEEQMSAVCIALPFLRSADLQAELMGCTYSEGGDPRLQASLGSGERTLWQRHSTRSNGSYACERRKNLRTFRAAPCHWW